MLKLCLTVILLGFVTQINCENLPVFIWGQKTPSFLPALKHLNGDEFTTLVKSQSDDKTLKVVFVENNLSVEDFSQCKLNTETCFQNLRKIEQKTYLSGVENPVKALEKSFRNQKQKSIFVSSNEELNSKVDGDEDVLFVYLGEAESHEDFAEHDELMSKLYNSLASKRGNVIAIYTARDPSFVYSKPLIRKTRDLSAKQEGGEQPTASKQTVLADSNGHLLFAVSSIQIGTTTVDVSTATITVNATDAPTHMNFDVKAGDHTFGFRLILSGGTWSVNSAWYDQKRVRTSVQVSAYDGKSFGCIEFSLTNGVDTLIRLADVQIQPLFNPTEGQRLSVFSSATNDCTGFFSAAIWGALFVVIMLVSILSCGLTWMMDIRTMDRFDDPKGKTITINAQE